MFGEKHTSRAPLRMAVVSRRNDIVMDNPTVRSGDDQDFDPVVWPDPSPLSSWWADVMSGSTVRTRTSAATAGSS
ncbi:hypothetical protein SAMN04244553_6591 [Nocardia amikacinitolerans]|uniref:Uncharacterized protein n=2 Tax=Nocardia amikacinitolerans TaxID=756689 RepID=A0A285LXD3_9NOCA|nr:hypothetical protein [Nocardia amikacinitolerans]MCP2298683.1 hypothetical protein [Nocardia amikacinitolerans]SNY89572.1 hypothetical protein SAMN04244553_6591 [Nocardia amikacinitolerans]